MVCHFLGRGGGGRGVKNHFFKWVRRKSGVWILSRLGWVVLVKCNNSANSARLSQVELSLAMFHGLELVQVAATEQLNFCCCIDHLVGLK